MTNTSRWSKAQDYERNWWDTRHNSIDLSYLKRFSEELIEFCLPYYTFDNKSKILEIGSGPAGIITHLPGELRCATDPLEDFYASVEPYTAYRDKKVEYSNAMGENLPYKDNSFDFVIIDNVLDHCENPDKVISEIDRVLVSGGIIYFKQNVYHKLGKSIRNILEKIEFDKGHPHNFTKNDVLSLFKKYDYKTLVETRRGHFSQLAVELRMKNMKALVRVLTFMTRDKITILLVKN